MLSVLPDIIVQVVLLRLQLNRMEILKLPAEAVVVDEVIGFFHQLPLELDWCERLHHLLVVGQEDLDVLKSAKGESVVVILVELGHGRLVVGESPSLAIGRLRWRSACPISCMVYCPATELTPNGGLHQSQSGAPHLSLGQCFVDPFAQGRFLVS